MPRSGRRRPRGRGRLLPEYCGSDSAPGTSPATAWRTLARVNQASLSAGDRVYLAGGQTFTGTLAFDAGDRGTGPFPIVRAPRYGSGRPHRRRPKSSGVAAYNTAGITISNIDIVGAGRTSNSGSGIEFYADLPGNVKLAGYPHRQRRRQRLRQAGDRRRIVERRDRLPRCRDH